MKNLIKIVLMGMILITTTQAQVMIRVNDFYLYNRDVDLFIWQQHENNHCFIFEDIYGTPREDSLELNKCYLSEIQSDKFTRLTSYYKKIYTSQDSVTYTMIYGLTDTRAEIIQIAFNTFLSKVTIRYSTHFLKLDEIFIHAEYVGKYYNL